MMHSKRKISDFIALIFFTKRIHVFWAIASASLGMSILINYFSCAKNTFSLSVSYIMALYIICFGIILPRNINLKYGKVWLVRENLKCYLCIDLVFIMINLILYPIEQMISKRTNIINITWHLSNRVNGIAAFLLLIVVIFIFQVILNVVYNWRHL